jgi:hypothetical protein
MCHVTFVLVAIPQILLKKSNKIIWIKYCKLLYFFFHIKIYICIYLHALIFILVRYCNTYISMLVLFSLFIFKVYWSH